MVRLEGDRYAWCDRLELDAADRRTVLEGEDVRLLTPGDRLENARRVEIRDAEDRASVDGPGRFRRHAAEHAASPTILAGRPTMPAAPADAAADFQVQWSRGLRVDPVADGGRRIEVTGDVDASGEAISLRGADRVVAVLAAEGDGPNAGADAAADDAFAGAGQLRRIEADGRLSAIALREDSSLDCRRMELDLRPGDGGPEPARLLATGDVRLRSPERRLWADSLDVAFAETAAAGDPAAATPAIESLQADGDVEVRLADGRRVLGERLEASGIEESAVLTGDVLLATANAVLDRATRIEIDEAGRVARVVGGGRFRGLATETPLPETDTRSNAEVIRTRAASAVQELEAVWTEGASWAAADAAGDAIADDGGQESGTLVLRGGVDAVAEPRLRERNRIRTEELTLVFAGDGTSGEAAAASPSSDDLAAADRRLARLIARGEARLESRAWLREDRADLPRVLAIDGPSIDWDQRAGVAVVDGPGRLLVRDLRQPEAAAGDGGDPAGGPAGDEDLPATGFGPRGTSQFTWTGGLRLEPAADDHAVSRITLRDEVTVLHQGLDGRTATLTAQRLVATMARVAGDGPGDEASTMAMGGPVELVSIAADGAVYVATPARDVSCEQFVYDARRGVASIASAPGRPPVSILEQGAASPVTISGSAEWDMVRDRIVVAGGAGSANGR